MLKTDCQPACLGKKLQKLHTGDTCAYQRKLQCPESGRRYLIVPELRRVSAKFQESADVIEELIASSLRNERTKKGIPWGTPQIIFI
jgi:hypothetical protein